MRAILIGIIVVFVGVYVPDVFAVDDASVSGTPTPTTADSATVETANIPTKRVTQDSARKEEVQNRLVERKSELMEKKEELEARIQERKEEIKANIDAVKDFKKRAITERIQDRLTTINLNRTDHFLKILDRLEEILEKIITRTQKAKADGVAVTEIETAIATAQQSISNTRSSVVLQAGKTYEITVTDESQAKTQVQTTVTQLKTDLNTTRLSVQDAVKSVSSIHSIIRRTVSTDIKESTSSAN